MCVKSELQTLIDSALADLQVAEELHIGAGDGPIKVERTRDSAHGDFACNVAMVLAKKLKRKPRELAEAIVAAMPPSPSVKSVEVAGPGFINVYLEESATSNIVGQVLELKQHFGSSDRGAGKKVQVEFVSANPTGPLHIGHGRGAAYGDALAKILRVCGYDVHTEYYVNDAGRQMDILAVSVWLRCLQLHGVKLNFPEKAYQGGYVSELAKGLDDSFVLSDLVVADNDDKELELDALIATAKDRLGAERFQTLHRLGLDSVLAGIRSDLESFGVEFDVWFSERSLTEQGLVDAVLAELEDKGALFEEDGARWFRSSVHGDQKDRVVVKANGELTYLSSDIAYHKNKLARGFEQIIDVWGADHHGHVPRIRAAMISLGLDPDCLTVLLVQFANLYRGDEKVQMSTRSGEFVTLAQLCEDVGKDAARFFYVMRKSEQHLDFDLELAKSASKENPVYYVQYAHARVWSVLRQLEERGIGWDAELGAANIGLLKEAGEHELLAVLARYPEAVTAAATNLEPHLIANYLRELAGEFHTYYNAHKIIVDDDGLRNARLNLSVAVRQTIYNGLQLLGVSAPEHM
jgi:arginyl-tRNA synthetase